MCKYHLHSQAVHACVDACFSHEWPMCWVKHSETGPGSAHKDRTRITGSMSHTLDSWISFPDVSWICRFEAHGSIRQWPEQSGHALRRGKGPRDAAYSWAWLQLPGKWNLSAQVYLPLWDTVTHTEGAASSTPSMPEPAFSSRSQWTLFCSSPQGTWHFVAASVTHLPLSGDWFPFPPHIQTFPFCFHSQIRHHLCLHRVKFIMFLTSWFLTITSLCKTLFGLFYYFLSLLSSQIHSPTHSPCPGTLSGGWQPSFLKNIQYFCSWMYY